MNYNNLKEYKKANAYYLRALEIQELLANENPKAFRPELENILNNLGANYNALKEYEKSERYLQRAREVFESISK